MVGVRDADIACRGFSVTIISEDGEAGGSSAVRDVSEDDEDSDSS